MTVTGLIYIINTLITRAELVNFIFGARRDFFMPHLTIEYSSNLGHRMDIADLVGAIHQAALETGIFPVGGTRTRAVARTDYAIADGDPENMFVHLQAHIAKGRDDATKELVTEALFGALCDGLAEIYASVPLAISFELTEIEPVHSRRKNNIHDRLKAKRKGADL